MSKRKLQSDISSFFTKASKPKVAQEQQPVASIEGESIINVTVSDSQQSESQPVQVANVREDDGDNSVTDNNQASVSDSSEHQEVAATSGSLQESGRTENLPLSLVPLHITDVDVLPIQSSGGRNRKFNAEWYQKFPWLHWHGDKLLCHTCATACKEPGLLLSKRIESAFSCDGVVCNWKKGIEIFTNHGRSHAHKEAVEKLALMKSKTSVLQLIDKHVSSDQCDARAALRIITTTLLTLGQIVVVR